MLNLLTTLFIGLNVFLCGKTKDIEQYKNITGIVGQKVILPCDIIPVMNDDQVSLVLWYKDKSTTSVYSLDSRSTTSLEDASHVASDNFAGRSYFSTIHRPAHLAIDYLKEDDEGFYRCRVDFKKSRTTNTFFYLRITVPPSKPIIKDLKGEIHEGIIGPYNEGTRLILVCEVDKGKPIPNVTWWKDSHLIDGTYSVTTNNIVRNELILGELGRHHLMALYSCQATNSDLSFPASTAVKLNMNLKPLDVKIIGNHRPLSANTVLHVTCRTRGSLPSAHISWWKGSVKLVSSREEIIENGNATLNYLTFVPSADDNGKFLVCRAHNPSITRSSMEDSWKLEVHYIPQLHLRLGRNIHYSNIKEGNDVHFECNIRANPWVQEVGWRFQGEDIYSDESKGILLLNQTLVLHRVQRSSRGHYTCTSVNLEGKGESNPVYLRVQHTPICKKEQKFQYSASLRDQLQVTCQIVADPTDVTIYWKTNTTVPIDYFTKGTTSIATYVPESTEDINDLFCWGMNAVGVQRVPCVFSLVLSGPPGAVNNCTVSEETDVSFRVDCQPGYDGGLQQHFLLELYRADCQEVYSRLQSSTPHFLVQGLTPFSSFLIMVSASNTKGYSKAVILKANTLSPSGELTLVKESREEFMYRPALIVAGSVLVVIILAASIVLRTVCHKKKRDTCIMTAGEREISKDELNRHYRCNGECVFNEIKAKPCICEHSTKDKLLKDTFNTNEEDMVEMNRLTCNTMEWKTFSRSRLQNDPKIADYRNNTIGGTYDLKYHKNAFPDRPINRCKSVPYRLRRIYSAEQLQTFT